MNVHDWLANLPFSDPESNCRIVEVSFNNGSRKDYFKNNTLHYYERGAMVAVEGVGGFDVGMVNLTGELVRLQLKKNNIDEKSPEIKKVLRRATPQDIEKMLESKAKENCRRAIREGRDPIKRENKSFRICISCWRMGMPSCLILTSSGIKPHQKSTCCLGGEHFLIIPPFLLDPDRYIDPDQCLHTVIGKLLRIATKDPKTQVDPGITLKQRNEWVLKKVWKPKSSAY